MVRPQRTGRRHSRLLPEHYGRTSLGPLSGTDGLGSEHSKEVSTRRHQANPGIYLGAFQLAELEHRSELEKHGYGEFELPATGRRYRASSGDNPPATDLRLGSNV